MDKTPQTITREEADAALLTLRSYAAQRQPNTEPSSIAEAVRRDTSAEAFDAVAALLDGLNDPADTSTAENDPVTTVLSARYGNQR